MRRPEGKPLPRRSIWIAQLLSIAGLITYVLLVRILAPSLQEPSRQGSIGVGLLLALVPAVLWLLLFYVQDAREPEPLGYVLRVALAGGVLGTAVALPVLQRVYVLAGWVNAGPLVGLLGSILVVGVLHAFCVYLAVRFTVYETSEFDEVADGVTYGTAAGIGLAAILNVSFVMAGPSISVVPAAIRIVVIALGQSAFGGVVGYSLALAKMHRQPGRAIQGFLAAIVLNGVFSYFLREVTQTGLIYRPWNGLVLAAAVAVIVSFVLLRLEHARTTLGRLGGEHT